MARPLESEPHDVEPPAIVADRVGKARGARRPPLSRLSFRVAQGEIVGLIGPLGAGKSTLLRLAATLTVPDSGRLYVLGHDAHTHAMLARRSLGYMSQSGGLDPILTGEEQVRLAGRLRGLGRMAARRRADELLALVDLGALAGYRAGLYPLAARKRLSLACALAAHPRLLLLDDPTGDLPARERQLIWTALRHVRAEERTTIVVATHHLEEAESVCERVGILDAGRLIALGSPSELQAQVSGATVSLHLAAGSDTATAAYLIERLSGVRSVWTRPDRLEAQVTSVHTLPSMIRLLEEHEITVRQALVSKPSLDQVFFRHTGRTIRDAQLPHVVGTGAPDPC
ncbi:MAG TPA: ABC transporter ATP-binding protein [Chloroflexota bacterium]|nr:ABC transporter ATP-binding protein [Chloroflexota bacterium]